MAGKALKVAVVGSRGYPRLELVDALIGRLASWSARADRSVYIISGTEPGDDPEKDRVDERAIREARRLGLMTVVYAADWEGQGRAAGPLRNSVIVADADALVAFWDLRSRGTADAIDKGLGRGIVRQVYRPDGKALSIEAIGDAVRRVLAWRSGA